VERARIEARGLIESILTDIGDQVQTDTDGSTIYRSTCKRCQEILGLLSVLYAKAPPATSCGNRQTGHRPVGGDSRTSWASLFEELK